MSISELTNYQYISLVGHFNSQNQSSVIDPRLMSKNYSPEQIKALEEQLEKRNIKVSHVSLNIKFKKDLNEFRVSTFDYLLNMYIAYSEHNILPYPGSFVDQPNKIIEVFNLFKQLFSEREQHLQREYKKDAKKLKSGGQHR